VRVLGKERLWKAANSKIFFGGGIYYNDRLGTTGGRPFDAFDLHFQLTLDNKPHAIGLFNINALMRGWEAGEDRQINTSAHFTYVDNEAYTYGGQSVSASYLARFGKTGGFENRIELYLEGILLGASKSDYFNLSGREYDYGPGMGARADYSLIAADRAALRALYRGSWIHSINGTSADHLDHFFGITGAFMIRSWFRLGIDYINYRSKRWYKDYPDVSTKDPTLQVYFDWRLD
jgi:hypothetical protein